MPKTRFLLCLSAALIFLAGCNPQTMMKKVVSDEDEQGATQCIEALRQKRFSAIEAHLPPELQSPDTLATLEHMANLLPAGQPDSIALVGADINTSREGARTADISYQYTFGKRYFLVNCATRTEEQTRHIVNLNVRELEFSIEKQAGFSLAEKTPGQYALLLAGLLALALTLAALITCVLQKGLQRKWLWVVFILVGIGRLSVNWNTGVWDFQALNVTLFSANAVSRGYGGWVLAVGLPLGAAVYLIRRFLNHRAAARSKSAGNVQ